MKSSVTYFRICTYERLTLYVLIARRARHALVDDCKMRWSDVIRRAEDLNDWYRLNEAYTLIEVENG
ncbi:hypothetical protein JYU34_000499 [Plutella xylostella]|uniref:Uncharacterized protein n=1 Tax=Plutella xylostella TaxID=51655 RepID=A0ABQ7R7W6_PLUXY|nr:hypothetical protein JYU34_000499 [Plutella xylostella]